MLGDVNCGSVKCFKNSAFENRNTYAPNVPYVAVWPNNPLSHITATALFMHHSDGFSHGRSIIRVDGVQILLEVWGAVMRVKTKNFVDLIRPIDIQTLRPTDTQIV